MPVLIGANDFQIASRSERPTTKSRYMSTLTITNAAILRWWNTIQKWRATEDIHLGLHPNIGYLENKIRFPANGIMNATNAITKRYYYLDEAGQVKYEGETGKELPCLLPDMKEDDYDKEVQELMSKKIEIKL